MATVILDVSCPETVTKNFCINKSACELEQEVISKEYRVASSPDILRFPSQQYKCDGGIWETTNDKCTVSGGYHGTHDQTVYRCRANQKNPEPSCVVTGKFSGNKWAEWNCNAYNRGGGLFAFVGKEKGCKVDGFCDWRVT